MGHELYQLVAISDNGIEYIIGLNNDNKNNKSNLEFIDYGTTRFKNEKHLIEYLYNNGKIPTKNVKLTIKYAHEGPRYIPVVFDDEQLYSIAKNKVKAELYEDYVFYILKKLETTLSDKIFFKYLLHTNRIAMNKYCDGNYLNLKLIKDINEFFNLYILSNKDDSNKIQLECSILKELFNYKQLRTLHIILNEYMKLKGNLLIQHYSQDLNISSSYNDILDIPDEINYAYINGGMDEVYSIVDLDDLIAKEVKLK